LRDKIKKKSSNEKGLKKININQENKNQIWHKIKWTKILRDAIEKIIQLKKWYKILRKLIEKNDSIKRMIKKI
jgi:hypothetical protein